MKPFHNRKAQITVFIILGIIIIFSVGIYSYLRTTGISPTEVFQPKSPPVVAFIEACMDKVATEAIRTMGDQGGFILLPTDVALNPTRHVSLVPGVGGEYAPKVPHWYYEGRTRIPGIKYMANEVKESIDAALPYCLNNFTDMSDEYIIKELSNFSSSVVFAEKETLIGLDYSIEIQPRGAKEATRKDQFLIKLDVQVKRMHELAKAILEKENRDTHFENMTINLMAAHPPEDIPFTGLSLDCKRQTWLLSSIKTKLMTALSPAVAATRFENTDHEAWDADEDTYANIHKVVTDWRESPMKKPLVLPKNIPDDSYDYFQYNFRFTDKDYKDLKVVSSFKKEWGMNLLATPNEYGVLKSGTHDLKSQILSFLCLNTYHFVYDLTYPVVVSINDPKAFHKSGYVFRFAFPVQIFHNKPDRSLLPTTIIEPTEYALDYCGLSDGEEHTIIARDIVTNAELSRVNLSFRCISQLCVLGSTRSNNRHLQWAGPFPEGCLGPVIIANKSGYLETEVQYDGREPFYIDMYPTQPVKFDLRRHTELEPLLPRMLDPDMYAILQLEHKDPSMSIFDVYGGDEIFNRTQTFGLLRADATYYVNIMLLKKKSSGDDLIIGGWIGNWTVNLEDILDAEKVVFHVPQKFPSPKTEAEIISVYRLMTNRSLFPGVEHELIRADEYTGEAST
jgi:hypothetical protein